MASAGPHELGLLGSIPWPATERKRSWRNGSAPGFQPGRAGSSPAGCSDNRTQPQGLTNRQHSTQNRISRFESYNPYFGFQNARGTCAVVIIAGGMVPAD